jgi:hypothetical protein
MDIGDGERGRNRTSNLLFNGLSQQLFCFSDFPTVGVGNLRQEWAGMEPNLEPSLASLFRSVS